MSVAASNSNTAFVATENNFGPAKNSNTVNTVMQEDMFVKSGSAWK
jgi:hypothetical protein